MRLSFLVSASVAAGGCGTRPEPLSETGASLAFLSPYARAISRACKGKANLEINVSRWVSPEGYEKAIATDPMMSETAWKLSVCGQELEMTLDCSGRCVAHDWPLPAHVATRRHDDPLLEELLAVVESEPRCIDDGTHCCRRGFNLRRVDAATSRYELTQCGRTRTVEVHCSSKEWAHCTAATVSP